MLLFRQGKGVWNKDIRYTYNNGDNNAAVNYIDAGIKPDILAPGVDIKIRKQTAYETGIVSATRAPACTVTK